MRIETNELGVDLGASGRSRLERVLAATLDATGRPVGLVYASMRRSEGDHGAVTFVVAMELLPAGRVVVVVRDRHPQRAIERAVAQLPAALRADPAAPS